MWFKLKKEEEEERSEGVTSVALAGWRKLRALFSELDSQHFVALLQRPAYRHEPPDENTN